MLPRFAVHAMGTRFEVVVDDGDLVRARAAAEGALERIEECDARLSAFRSDALIARANREAFARPVKLDPETFELLEACQRLRDDTRGAFDVSVGGFLRAHGFHPPLAPIAGAPSSGFQLDRTARTVRFASAGTRLDLGGIGKGHALHLAADALREAGVEKALLHGGTSSVLALGAWRVAVGACVLELRDAALSVSSTSGRARAGRGHLIDPRDGRALPTGTTCAVVARSPRLAEAWSTALCVLDARGELDGAIEAALVAVGATARRASVDDPDSARVFGAFPELFTSAHAALTLP
ncbi:MAG: FAD:protein FMN transferase [Planctomycetes bacterium]|nr:FAD:protein FMN transferase [Planctomycetota bacterium]